MSREATENRQRFVCAGRPKPTGCANTPARRSTAGTSAVRMSARQERAPQRVKRGEHVDMLADRRKRLVVRLRKRHGVERRRQHVANRRDGSVFLGKMMRHK